MIPLETMLARRSPGAIAPKIACMTLVIVLIGPQFVSPSTRSATSPSGTENRIASTECQIGVPKKTACAAMRKMLAARLPIQTQRSGRSPEALADEARPLNVRIEHAPSEEQRRHAAGDQHADRRPHDEQQDVDASRVSGDAALATAATAER